MSKIKIKVKKPWIAYPGSTLQQNYAEDLEHGYLLWDVKKDDWSVEFKPLPNPRPYITIDWQGNIRTTLENSKCPPGARFRIRSTAKIPSKDTHELIKTLKNDYGALEVVFKDDHVINRSHVSTGKTTVVKDDLRNPDILLKLLKEHYTGADMHEEEWHVVWDLLKNYVNVLKAQTKTRSKGWTLRSFEFSNLFSYGQGNKINFEKMNGMVGIFGPNKCGKSSVPGALMYTLFNSTDRGLIKNKHIVNSRHDEGRGRAVINVDGSDYVIDRITKKSTNKRGDINSSTDLHLYKLTDDCELDLLSGEQRTDTEKTLRDLIGVSDDFLMTSFSSQGESNVFLKHGETKRRQIISQYCDIDVLYQIHDLAKNDVRDIKTELRTVKNVDWKVSDWELHEIEKRNLLSDDEDNIVECVKKIDRLRSEMQVLRTELTMHKNAVPVTENEINDHKEIVKNLQDKLKGVNDELEGFENNKGDLSEKIKKLEKLLQLYDLASMKQTLESYNKTESAVTKLKTIYDSENERLARQKKTLKILDEVPCGDKFPSCKFIKDAHETKRLVDPQKEKVNSAKKSFDEAKASLDSVKIKELIKNIEKIETLKDRKSDIKVKTSNLSTEIVRSTNTRDLLEGKLKQAKTKLEDLSEAYYNNDNVEIVTIRSKINKLDDELRSLEKKKLDHATNVGRLKSELEQILSDKERTRSTLQRLKAYEVITAGFSKKGVPNMILSSLLPVINLEVNKVLNGIVDFTVELEKEYDSDHVDILLNYGDSKRILELGSGHEKMISSIALRVGLINCSSLPKSDIFIIDEGFGVFDAQGQDECNRLLRSLTKYFKTVMIITHIDGVKDIADTMLEITKSEHDSKIVYD